jgi:hypothetical protein
MIQIIILIETTILDVITTCTVWVWLGQVGSGRVGAGRRISISRSAATASALLSRQQQQQQRRRSSNSSSNSCRKIANDDGSN